MSEKPRLFPYFCSNILDVGLYPDVCSLLYGYRMGAAFQVLHLKVRLQREQWAKRQGTWLCSFFIREAKSFLAALFRKLTPHWPEVRHIAALRHTEVWHKDYLIPSNLRDWVLGEPNYNSATLTNNYADREESVIIPAWIMDLSL